ncbi:MAG TPA: hypothetical protein VH209_08470, partial [Steroidobacteraceae bacterium]|nr:hypothetical protein [Steroidobacteraceae bacterium]
AFSPDLGVFACARLVQAFGMGIAVVLIRSAVSDVCDLRGTASVFSTAVTMVSLECLRRLFPGSARAIDGHRHRCVEPGVAGDGAASTSPNDNLARKRR